MAIQAPEKNYLPSIVLFGFNGLLLLMSEREISTFQKVGIVASAAFQAFRPHFEEELSSRFGKEVIFPFCNFLPFAIVAISGWNRKVVWKELGSTTGFWGVIHCLTGFLAQAFCQEPSFREPQQPPLPIGDLEQSLRIGSSEPPLWIKKKETVGKEDLLKELAGLDPTVEKYKGKGKGFGTKHSMDESYERHFNLCRNDPELFSAFVEKYLQYEETRKKLIKDIKVDSHFADVTVQLEGWLLLFEKTDLVTGLLQLSDEERLTVSICYIIKKCGKEIPFQIVLEDLSKKVQKTANHEKIIEAFNKKDLNALEARYRFIAEIPKNK